MAGRLIKGYWDCKYCDTMKIGGDKTSCPNCGKPRDEDTRFYMDHQRIEYVPEEKAKKINRNPDWICHNCKQLNSDDLTNCKWYGSGRDLENLTYHQNIRHSSNANDTTTFTPKISYTKPSSSHSQTNRFTINQSPKKILLWILIPIIVALSVWGIVKLFTPKEYDVTIEAFKWIRGIEIQINKTFHESDWTMPVGARLRYSQTEFSHYTQVLDHYETKTRTVSRQEIVGYEEYVSGYRDLGNGYFEEVTSSRPIYQTVYDTETYQEPVYRDEPVYRTKYYYDIDRWVYSRTIPTEASDHEPYWGTYTLTEKERVSAQYAQYMIIVTIDDERKTFEMSYSDWASLEIGDQVRIKVLFGNATIIKDEESLEVFESTD